jgi:hypothetical protein
VEELLAKDELLANRAFVFGTTDDEAFDEHVETRMREDGTHRYLHFIALSEAGDDGRFKVFAVLDCNSDPQAKGLARRYFHSTLAYGRVMGAMGLKHI